MERFARKEDEYKIGWIKRFMEYESMIPGFREEIMNDPENTLKKYGFPLAVEEVSFLPSDPEDIYTLRPAFPESDASKYADFMRTKISFREEIKEAGKPANDMMRKWHKRQKGRCLAELGARSDVLVYVPFTIELADGCSVGCKFCGLNAGQLKSVFRYTDENALLFNEVLSGVKELIGDGAGCGTMYFATEPLDNPDYEFFLKDYVRIFGKIPQITTATALKHTELLHRLLKEINEEGKPIYRFSVLSEKDALKVFEEFTPEELVYTELIPQYENAPQSGFVNVGRKGKDSGEYGDTISCVTGFIVNFSRKTVRLTAPTYACEKYPTGEIIFETAEFTDAGSCIDVMKAMISKYMSNIIGPKDRVRLKTGLTYRTEGDEIIVEGGKGARFNIAASEGSDIYKEMLVLFSSGYHTKREIVAQILSRYEGMLVRSDTFHYAINRLWELGILELESGKV
jgi:radical SAM family RiPP maturation amino acid epimerase